MNELKHTIKEMRIEGKKLVNPKAKHGKKTIMHNGFKFSRSPNFRSTQRIG